MSAGITERILTVAESGTAILAVFFRSHGRDARATFIAISEQIAPKAFRGLNGSDRRECSARTIGRLSLQS
ncbi:MAG: hypothetical protein SGI98_03770 [Verrucomicrobiota bacterium]|nr:hypothetical protein [Verrucomicrobiota bacterium]